jgi:hypothetical protein
MTSPHPRTPSLEYRLSNPTNKSECHKLPFIKVGWLLPPSANFPAHLLDSYIAAEEKHCNHKQDIHPAIHPYARTSICASIRTSKHQSIHSSFHQSFYNVSPIHSSAYLSFISLLICPFILLLRD